jgi:hypothetical protein
LYYDAVVGFDGDNLFLVGSMRVVRFLCFVGKSGRIRLWYSATFAAPSWDESGKGFFFRQSRSSRRCRRNFNAASQRGPGINGIGDIGSSQSYY